MEPAYKENQNFPGIQVELKTRGTKNYNFATGAARNIIILDFRPSTHVSSVRVRVRVSSFIHSITDLSILVLILEVYSTYDRSNRV